MKRWLAAQPPPATIGQLQDQIDGFADKYNQRRPHRSLGRLTPTAAYQQLPKATPAGSDAGSHHRVRHDCVDKTGRVTLRVGGRLHHIGIGRAHTGLTVIMLVADHHVRVIATDTGDLIRALDIDPTRDYQPIK
jgi:Integrase core domain